MKEQTFSYFAFDHKRQKLHAVSTFLTDEAGMIIEVELLPYYYSFPVTTFTYFQHSLN